MKAVSSRKMVCPISGDHTDEMNLPNIIPISDWDIPVVNSRVTAFRKYSTDHPPTTL